MNTTLSEKSIIESLEALSKWLRVRAPEKHFQFLVVGGSALAFHGFKDKTLDVDVLKPDRLDPLVEEGVAAVARSRGLGREWLSSSVANIFRQLRLPREWPSYFEKIEKRIEIGGNLSVLIAGRQALISLKLFAATPSLAKHLDDLRSMDPIPEEMKTAITFVKSVDSTDVRRDEICGVLDRLGFDSKLMMDLETW